MKRFAVMSMVVLVGCDYAVQAGANGGGSATAGGGSGQAPVGPGVASDAGNSSVVYGGVKVEPVAAYDGTYAYEGQEWLYAWLTTEAGVCAQRSACSLSGYFQQTDSRVLVVVSPPGIGTFPIDAKTAQWHFSAKVDGGAVSASAKSGTITVEAYTPGEGVAGKYLVTTTDGVTLRGSFSSRNCPGFQNNVQGGGTVCEDLGNKQACTNTCTCQQKKVSVSCGAPDGGFAECTCTSASGKTKVCQQYVSTQSKPATSCSVSTGYQLSCCREDELFD